MPWHEAPTGPAASRSHDGPISVTPVPDVPVPDAGTARRLPHLTERHWWPPLGRSHGHQRAVFMTATGQFLLALDKRVRKT